jgi:hypothetical protein
MVIVKVVAVVPVVALTLIGNPDRAGHRRMDRAVVSVRARRVDRTRSS